MKHRTFDVSFGSEPPSVCELRTFLPMSSSTRSCSLPACRVRPVNVIVFAPCVYRVDTVVTTKIRKFVATITNVAHSAEAVMIISYPASPSRMNNCFTSNTKVANARTCVDTNGHKFRNTKIVQCFLHIFVDKGLHFSAV